MRSAEILQGGPSVVFAGGQIGATAELPVENRLLGPSGSLGLTYGDENLCAPRRLLRLQDQRDWYGSIGGFYRVSDGVRDPQFNADEGGQLTAMLKRESDKGDLVLYARYLDDKNQFITPGEHAATVRNANVFQRPVACGTSQEPAVRGR